MARFKAEGASSTTGRRPSYFGSNDHPSPAASCVTALAPSAGLAIAPTESRHITARCPIPDATQQKQGRLEAPAALLICARSEPSSADDAQSHFGRRRGRDGSGALVSARVRRQRYAALTCERGRPSGDRTPSAVRGPDERRRFEGELSITDRDLRTTLSWSFAPPTGLEPVALRLKINACRTSRLTANPRKNLRGCSLDVGGSSRLGVVLRGG
jgi:hypothetical protein